MGELLAALDVNFWTIHSATTPQVVACYCPLDSCPEIEDVRRAVAAQLESFPRLRRRAVRRLFWRWEEDPLFDLNWHVRVVGAPGAETHDDLNRAVERHFASPIDLAKPLWEFVIFRGTGPNPPAGVMWRTHHALADGLAGREFFYRVCRSSRDESAAADAERKGGRAAPSSRATASFGVDFWKSLRHLLLEYREKTIRSVLNGRNSPQREIRLFDLPFHELRSLRRRLGTPLNDVLLALVGRTIGRYQSGRGGPLERVKILMPVSLRRRQHEAALGNHLTGVGVSIPTGEIDPHERLQLIHRAINRIKVDGSLGAYRILGVVAAWLPASLRRRVLEAAARRINFICTNVPGPDKPIYLCGSKLLGTFGCIALMRNQGIAFGFISYAEKMCAAIVSDPAVVPDIDELVRYFLESYDELRQVALEDALAVSSAAS